MDEITINLRALTERQRNNVKKVLIQALNDIEDDVNVQALSNISAFVEDGIGVPNPTKEQNIVNAIELSNECYLICLWDDGDYTHGELLPSANYVSGEDDGSFTNDHNICFNTPTEAQSWYNREYVKVWAFSESDEKDEFWNEYIEENL